MTKKKHEEILRNPMKYKEMQGKTRIAKKHKGHTKQFLEIRRIPRNTTKYKEIPKKTKLRHTRKTKTYKEIMRTYKEMQIYSKNYKQIQENKTT